jgi:hypothetical protein
MTRRAASVSRRALLRVINHYTGLFYHGKVPSFLGTGRESKDCMTAELKILT